VNFERYDIAGPFSLPVAQHYGAELISRIAGNPGAARSYPERRVLIPRSEHDGTELHFDLADALSAVAAVDDDEATHEQWVPTPHVSDDCREMLSITGLALDSSALPWPKPGHVAAQSSVASAMFQDYLVSQGVHMTDLARVYLAGTEEAGPGEKSLKDRHAAGAAAILNSYSLRDIVAEVAPSSPQFEANILALGSADVAKTRFTDVATLSRLLGQQ
jgi:hypothetical protein